MAEREALKDPLLERRLYGRRVLIAGLVMALLFVALGTRYFQLQVTGHEVYRTQSDRNRIQLQSIAPKRGLIYARNGELLAENVPSHTLTIVRERVDDLDATFELLRELIDLQDAEIERFRRRQNYHRPYKAIPLRFMLSEEEIAVISVNRHRMPGVEVDAELVRHYPHGELFAHALGYVGRISERELREIDPVNYSGTHHIGKLGVERQYENILHGTVGYQNVETNARGRVLRVLDRHDPAPGRDIQLHLDVELQRVAHEAMGEEHGAVVAIDIASGGVLALVSTPSYDNNLFVNGISSEDYNRLRGSLDMPLFNRAVQGQYPPGSTIKPIFGLAGLHHGVVSESTTIDDPGWYSLPNDDRVYRDWRPEGHGSEVDLHQAIAESCDTYYYDLAYNLGIDRLHSFAVQFGLGYRTGIDLPNERTGLMPSREWKRQARGLHWFPGETLNVGIGQGMMLTTPLQLATSTAVMAARGERREPRLLKALGGEAVGTEEREAVTPVDERHWDAVQRAMEGVVHGRRGTARAISRDIDYRIAGKTGTAQVVSIAGEDYDAELLARYKHDHALFIGYAPAEDPEIAVAVIVEHGGSGSAVAAPIVRKVIDARLRHIDDDREGMAHAAR